MHQSRVRSEGGSASLPMNGRLLPALRNHLAFRLLSWTGGLSSDESDGPRPSGHRVLLFCHGYSLAHTIRPLVVGRALQGRGYRVSMAGRGSHMARIRDEGFPVYDVETLSQDRINAAVARGEYAYYDAAIIDRCVCSERALIRRIGADVVVHDFKPTVALSARLEGVDDVRITQAYNMPGYAHAVEAPRQRDHVAAPFDAYLAARAAEVKPQRSLCLLADIPELHPPGGEPAGGYYYVGPLVESVPVPAHIPELDEGWDSKLPLVYITCGSSGRAPDYLDELVARAAKQPWRFVITTAGRWEPSCLPGNVRVFPFMPGDWILSRASLLVGVPGIGAIYQALSRAVPVLGAPEHADQEYHLNRIRDLGVGIKVDRRDWSGAKMLNAAAAILENVEQYKQRCMSLSRALQNWNAGEAAADLIDAHFTNRDARYPVHSSRLVTAEFFAAYLFSSTPADMTLIDVRRLLLKGVRKGLPCRVVHGTLHFDLYESWNWLHDNEPEFFESDYRAQRSRRMQFQQVADGVVSMRHPTQSFHVEYRLSIQVSAEIRGKRIKVFLPFPVSKQGRQDRVSLLECMPRALEQCFAPEFGFFYGYTCALPDGGTELSFSYRAQVRVHEQRGDVTKAAQAEPVDSRHLKLPKGFHSLPEVIQFRNSLTSDPDRPAERAREIYLRLLNTTRFSKTVDHASGVAYSAQRVLRRRVGHCVSLSRTFIALCRCEGIPAREATGALLGYPVAPDRYCREGYCEPVFGHTWCEVRLPDRGWIPVEFHALDIGQWADTGGNVEDPQVREWMASEGPGYRHYYFGNLDHQRIHCSNSAKLIPPFLLEERRQPVGTPDRWVCPESVQYLCRLEVQPL